MIYFSQIDSGKIPKKKHSKSPGYEVFSNQDITINPGQIRTIRLGFKINGTINDLREHEFYYFGLYLRESLGRKGLILVNGVGILEVDNTSNREVTILVFNPLEDPQSYENRNVSIKRFENIAQIILHKSERRVQ